MSGPEPAPGDVSYVKIDPDGIVAILHHRICDGTLQYTWIRQEDPEVYAGDALRSIESELLPAPEVSTAPPDRAIVNLESWLSVSDPGPVSATAGIPGLSVTVTARVASTTWRFGARSVDEVVVECEGAGQAWTRADGERPAPCGHTFTAPTDGSHGHRAEVTMTWQVSWSATNGASGTLPSVTSAPAMFDFPVDEIQTIGTRG